MRVMHVLNHVNNSGNGIVNCAVDLACHQAQRGFTVAVASKGGGYEPLLARYNVTHLTLNLDRKPVNLLKSGVRFRKLVRQFQPEIVHCHMITAMMLTRFLRAGLGYRSVSHVQNVYLPEAKWMGLADAVICVSSSVARDMEARGVPKRKLYVALNTTVGSPRLPSLDEVVPASLCRPAIVTVGGMYRRKGISELIAAFEKIGERFPEAHLYLVGDGPDRNLFEQQAGETAVKSRIHFEGYQDNPKAYLKAAEVFVLASHRESCPLVISDAQEAGCPIVATDVDGIPEQLEEGRIGMLVPAGNSEALAEALRKLLTDASERGRLSRLGREHAESYGVAEMDTLIEDAYRTVSAG